MTLSKSESALLSVSRRQNSGWRLKTSVITGVWKDAHLFVKTWCTCKQIDFEYPSPSLAWRGPYISRERSVQDPWLELKVQRVGVPDGVVPLHYVCEAVRLGDGERDFCPLHHTHGVEVAGVHVVEVRVGVLCCLCVRNELIYHLSTHVVCPHTGTMYFWVYFVHHRQRSSHITRKLDGMITVW